VIRTQTTSLAHSVLQGKASTHPVNVSTNTSSSFDLGPPVIWVKSNCQSSLGRPLSLCTWHLESFIIGIINFFSMFHIPVQLVGQCPLI
jgi:hypothetical protein